MPDFFYWQRKPSGYVKLNKSHSSLNYAKKTRKSWPMTSTNYNVELLVHWNTSWEGAPSITRYKPPKPSYKPQGHAVNHRAWALHITIRSWRKERLGVFKNQNHPLPWQQDLWLHKLIFWNLNSWHIEMPHDSREALSNNSRWLHEDPVHPDRQAHVLGDTHVPPLAQDGLHTAKGGQICIPV